MSKLIEPVFDLDREVQISTNREKEDIYKVSCDKKWDTPGTHPFEINNQQYYLFIKPTHFYYDIDLTITGGDDKITLENNFFPRLFSTMRFVAGGQEIEGIHEGVGEASTILNFIMTSDTFKRTYGQLSGWFPDTGKGDRDMTDVDYNSGYYSRMKIYNNKKKFTGIFPLAPLFGFTDFDRFLHLIQIRLELNLKSEAEFTNDIFYGDAAATGKLTINKVELHVPYVVPSKEVQEYVGERLLSKKPIDAVFLKRSMNTVSVGTGATFSWALGNFTNSVRFVFVVFKKEAPAKDKNNALFVDGKVKSMRLQLNQTYYPIDRMQFNFDDYNISEPYLAYVNACKTFGNEPQMTLQEFHDLYPIFCFDTSAQPDNLKSNGIQLTLHIEKESTSKFEAFALVLEDAHYKIATGDGKMLRVE